MKEEYKELKPAVILDFGSQYTQLIAKRIRHMGVYSVILPCFKKLDEIMEYSPGAIIFSGGPSSIYEEDAPSVDPAVLELDNPILGICYGMQLLTGLYQGEIIAGEHREYGHTKIKHNNESVLFEGLPGEFTVWMSHGDRIEKLPEGFSQTASSSNAVAAIENPDKKKYCLQFHPEVVHTEHGNDILGNFLFKICGLEKNWSLPNFIEHQIRHIREQVGDKKVVLGLSGGVDSTVLAVLLHKAIGDQLTCVFVNNGVLRLNEAEYVQNTFINNFKINLKYIDAEKTFLRSLKGITSPEKKRHRIGKKFVKVFFNAVKDFDFLAQGTLYPDVIESVSTKGPSDTIKTHHNRVKQIMKLKEQGRILEPFEELFKDEVREIGREMGVTEEIIRRHPFPGPGLAIRIIGSVDKARLDVLRQADDIVMREIRDKGVYDDFWQCFAVLLPVKTVGVMGDKRTYGFTIALRMVESIDAMTADFSYPAKDLLTSIANKIIGQVKEVNRVVLDITSKPPGTIEWE